MAVYGSDSFPSRTITNPEKWIKYELSFDALRTAFPVHSQAFVSWMPVFSNPHKKIYYQFYEKTESIRNNELRNLKAAENVCEVRPVCWDAVIKKLQKPLVNSKNCDQRMCFRYRNIFLVKCYFTFGFRTVGETEYHLIQTGKNPLICYKQRRSVAKTQTGVVKQRSLCMQQKDFETCILCPETLYYVSSDTNYVLMACQKTLFVVDVVSKDAFKVLKKQYGFHKVGEKMNRLTKKSACDDFLPPATPAMDQVVDFYSEEVEKIPDEYSPDAESFFKPSKKRQKKHHEKRDSEGFKLPFLPLPSSSRKGVVSCTYTSGESAQSPPPQESFYREDSQTVQTDQLENASSDVVMTSSPENVPQENLESLETNFVPERDESSNFPETHYVQQEQCESSNIPETHYVQQEQCESSSFPETNCVQQEQCESSSFPETSFGQPEQTEPSSFPETSFDVATLSSVGLETTTNEPSENSFVAPQNLFFADASTFSAQPPPPLENVHQNFENQPNFADLSCSGHSNNLYYFYEQIPFAQQQQQQPLPLANNLPQEQQQQQQQQLGNLNFIDYTASLDDRDLNVPIENASVNLPTQMPDDSQLIDAIKDWLKSPNLDFLQHFDTNPPDLPLDLFSDIFN